MANNVTITAENWPQRAKAAKTMTQVVSGEKRQIMNDFLASVERRAFAIAKIAVTNPDDALELVQESMLKLVQLYSNKPREQWTPLFYKILQSRIRDWYRRNKVKNRIFSWFKGNHQQEDDYYGDPVEQTAAPASVEPTQLVSTELANKQLECALKTLSIRQQQCFLLRAWEGMSVKEAAFVMKCSEGSVKTHYSRAVHALKILMQDWNDE